LSLLTFREAVVLKMTRITLAYVIAPITPSVLFAAMFQITEPKMIALMLVFSLPFSYVPSIFLGIPFVAFLSRKDKLSILNLLWASAALGSVVFLLFGLVFASVLESSAGAGTSLRLLVSGAVIGLIVAVTFGLIAGLPFYRPHIRPPEN